MEHGEQAHIIPFRQRYVERINGIKLDLGRMSLLELRAHHQLVVVRDVLEQRFPGGRPGGFRMSRIFDEYMRATEPDPDVDTEPLPPQPKAADAPARTVKSDGEAYSQVSEPARRVPCDVYLCLKCKAQRVATPPEHKEGNL